MRSLLFSLMILLASAISINVSNAQETGLQLDGDAPIQIESDRLEIREKENLSIFTGNVNVVQGTTNLKAGVMRVYYKKDELSKSGEASKTGKAPAIGGDASGIERIEVEDNVFVRADGQHATADSGTFDMSENLLVLEGKRVVLSDGDNVLVGCKLTVHTKTGLAYMGNGCKGRVSVILSTDSRK